MEESDRQTGRGPDNRAVLEDAGETVKRGPRAWAWKTLGYAKIAFEIVVLAAAIWMFAFHVSVVSGHSMVPSLEAGDRLVVDKIGCQLGPVRRFDVVVFECPDQRDVDYVKRVLGLPGETVQLRGGELYVDHELVEQCFPHEREAYATYPEATLGDDEYYVVGDNRPRSRDSRSFFRPVRRSDIKGVVRFRLFPLDRMQAF